jgi:hypothetical protein
MTTGMLTLLLTLGVGGTSPDVYTMRNNNLEIPIRINDAKRPDIKELELHVSTDQGRTWTLSGKAKPEQQAFGFHAPGDGLYWFSVCAIDKAGRRDPEDIATAKPALKVLIDTSHPALQVVAVDRVNEEIQVAWECSDSQADPASLRLEYRPAGAEPTAVWTPVPIPPQLIGTYRFRPMHGGAITMRMQITDGTGSPATVVKDVPGAAIAATPPPAVSAFAPPPGPSSCTPPAPTSVAPPTPAPAAPVAVVQQPNTNVPPPVASFGALPGMTSPQPIPAAEPQAPAPMAAAQAAVAPPAPMEPPALAPLRSATDPAPRPTIAPPAPDFVAPANPSAHTPAADAPVIQHVRDKDVAIDFAVDRMGPSGVKKIEIYVTQDEGQHWFKYSETIKTNPPLQLDLPANDGLYGFDIVLYSGVGQSEGPPRDGVTTPQFRLLVDRTQPQVAMYAPVLDPNQPNALLLRYKANDANLVPDSVALFWRAEKTQPWQAIAPVGRHPAAQADGVIECSWTITPEIPNNVYLKVTARDQAGNVGEFVTRDPVMVDLNKPVARFKGVVTVSYRRPQ